VDVIDAQPILAAALNDARVSFALQAYAREGQATEEPWKRALTAAQDIGAETLIACTGGRTVHTELEAIDEGYRLANAAEYSPLAPHVRAKVDPLIAQLIAALRDVSARRGGLR
jgi:sugar phosphate isomerase/epimerase